MKKPVSQIGVTRYALFGEELAGEDPEFIHIEDIRTRSRLYEWRITPHVHQRMLQIVFVAEGSVQVHLEDRTQSLDGPCAITIPGGAVHRPAKRWPAEAYRALAVQLIDQDVTPVIIGGADEADLAAEIAARTGAIFLAGQTSLADVASLSRTAAAAIGNDTGPMHIAAICGCPSVVLFSKDSDPSITAPRGDDVTVLQRDNLADLPVTEVADALRLR